MFTTTTEYALRAAVFLAESPARQTAHSVAAATHVPERYMSKLLQVLVDAGLADSQRGPSGGFILSRPPRAITALEVVQAVEPIRRIETCPLGLPEHCPTLCPLHQLLDSLAGIAESRLGGTTLADLIGHPIMPLGIRPSERTIAPPR